METRKNTDIDRSSLKLNHPIHLAVHMLSYWMSRIGAQWNPGPEPHGRPRLADFDLNPKLNLEKTMLTSITRKSGLAAVALIALVGLFVGTARDAQAAQPKHLNKKQVKELIATANSSSGSQAPRRLL